MNTLKFLRPRELRWQSQCRIRLIWSTISNFLNGKLGRRTRRMKLKLEIKMIQWLIRNSESLKHVWFDIEIYLLDECHSYIVQYHKVENRIVNIKFTINSSQLPRDEMGCQLLSSEWWHSTFTFWLHRLLASCGDRRRHGIWFHRRKSCWGLRGRTHHPLCCQAGVFWP